MKNKKKILTIVAGLMVFSSTVAYASVTGFKDVDAKSPFYNAIQKVTSLGLMNADSGNFHPKDKVTREELADAVVKMTDYMNQLKSDESRVINAVANSTKSVVNIQSNSTNVKDFTGFFISPTEIVTSLSKLDQAPGYSVLIGQSSLRTVIKKTDKTNDIAILEVSDYKSESYFDFLNLRVETGQIAIVIGNTELTNGSNDDYTVSKGIVSKNYTSIAGYSYAQLNMTTLEESIGGPVFDTNGKLIGMVANNSSRSDGITFAVHYEDIYKAARLNR